jgi:hypothetical protein
LNVSQIFALDLAVERECDASTARRSIEAQFSTVHRAMNRIRYTVVKKTTHRAAPHYYY